MIELLAVTGIIIIVSTIVLANDNKFGGVVQLENLAYDVALAARQAQVYGISVQRFGSGTFSAGYGLHFSMATPNSYQLFADAITVNGLYDCPSPGTSNCELVQTTTIQSGYSIEKLCAPEGADSGSCTSVNQLDILFQRPEPDAWISASGNSCLLNSACENSARIVLISPRGDLRSIVIEANGQISVEQ